MAQIEQRLRRTLSALAGNEALSNAPDEEAAAEMLKWAEELAKYHVLETGEMEEAAAEEYLSPYIRAVRGMMRAISGWATEADQAVRLEWWTRIEQHSKKLYGDQFVLPAMEEVVTQLAADASMHQKVVFLKDLIENQAPKG